MPRKKQWVEVSVKRKNSDRRYWVNPDNVSNFTSTDVNLYRGDWSNVNIVHPDGYTSIADTEITDRGKITTHANCMGEVWKRITVRGTSFVLLSDTTAYNPAHDTTIEWVNNAWQLVQTSKVFHYKWLPDGRIQMIRNNETSL